MTPTEIEALVMKQIGFFDVTDHPDVVATAPKKVMVIPTAPRYQTLVNSLIPSLSIDNWVNLDNKFSSYPDRKYNTNNGLVSAQWVESQYLAYAANRPDITVRQFAHRFVQPSVIATIPGSGLTDEVVIIGGHIDSTSAGNAPGADDDASGSSSVLEAFRVLAESGFRPNRTLEFHGYAGEEGGLLGSQDIATEYQRLGVNVFAMVQFDMTCYSGRTGARNFGMTNDYTNVQLTTFVKRLVETYCSDIVGWAESTCGYGCSDHASFNRVGYPAAFPFEAPFGQHNPDIHTIRDTIDKCDLPYQEQALSIVLSAAIELSLQ